MTLPKLPPAPEPPNSIEGPTLLVVTPVVPPSPSGQSVVLERLLTDPRGKVLYASQNPPPDEIGRSDFVRLRIAKFHGPRGLPRILRIAAAVVRTVLSMTIRVLELCLISHRCDVDVIVGCTAGPTELPGAWLCGLITRRPVIAYLFDDPVLQWPPGAQRSLASALERLWAPRVRAIVVPNEALAEMVAARTSRATVLVRNPLPNDLSPRLQVRSTMTKPLRLVYTGSIYGAQDDAFRVLQAALELLGGFAELHVYTANTQAELRAAGITSSFVICHPATDAKQSIALQRAADALYLPLSFHSKIPEVIRTAAPAKLGEYLASGRPILVHAPSDSYLSRFFRETGAGIVADTENPLLLADAIRHLASDDQEIIDLAARASDAAKLFDISSARRQFWALVQEVVQ